MKNTQKILIAVLALVLIAVTALIIFVKTNKTDENNINNNPTDIVSNENNTVSADQTDNQNNHDVTYSESDNTPITNVNDNKTPSAGNNPSKEPTQAATKNYDLSSAELMQSQITSFGELKLYSTDYNGKKIYLFVIDNDGKKFFREIPGEYIIENIYYANIDGRFGDELIIRANTGTNTNPPTYKNYIFKITSKGFESLFSASDLNKFASGYRAELKQGFNVKISNSITGYSKTINVKGLNKNTYVGEYWDANGNLTTNKTKEQVDFGDGFHFIEPKDVDNDGIYEITCSQYTSLGKRSDCIGYANTVIKYDFQKKEFKVISTVFYSP
ncbi:MAG: hypothetical protein J6L89_01215 [Clostridia bacterium]|nr:hypothetical protein [Clostridia bacterium]